MEVLKFVPFNSTIHPGFWTELSKVKLDVSGLKEEPVDICGTFTNSDPQSGNLSPRLSLEWNAFEKNIKTNWNSFAVAGKVVIKNTVEAFKKEDKAAFIRRDAEVLWQRIVDGSWLENPEKLTSFSVLMFADLKKYMFYYWFSFPAFNLPAFVGLKQSQKIVDVLNRNQIINLCKCIKEGDHKIYNLFVLESDDKLRRVPLTSLQEKESSSLLLTVADPSSAAQPGWSLRNLVLALAITVPDQLSGLRLVCLRSPIKEGQLSIDSSLVLTLAVTGQPSPEMPGAVGWEKNDKGQMGPRLANMRSTMDPVKIAESSVDLNLKLMKWRLVPSLDLAKIQSTRCLLLGSGTLGCGVARSLLGWGVRNISLVDNGRVSYSNPVRQSLFTFKDCLEGGRPKATAAAEHLREIFPGVNAQGWELAIPMPGHTASGAILQQSKDNYHKLEELIREHDVIFLLMDSRESRWLPTALAALHPVRTREVERIVNIFHFSGEARHQRGPRVRQCPGDEARSEAGD